MTIGVLSWGATKTLENTLKSYHYHGLKNGEQNIALLQEGTAEQETICRYYGFTPITTHRNYGIALGYQLLLQAADEPTFLFLENDWELIEEPSAAISLGNIILNTGVADIVRYRHRDNPGNPLWSRQFQGREYDRPEHLLDSIHWTNPSYFKEIKFRRYEYIRLIGWDIAILEQGPVAYQDTMDWYITTAPYANWTNNPHMGLTDFLRREIMPRLGSGDLEKDIQSWWQQQSFKVAQSDGLFTHNRLD